MTTRRSVDAAIPIVRSAGPADGRGRRWRLAESRSVARRRSTTRRARFGSATTRWDGVLHSLEPLDEAAGSIAIDGLRVQLVTAAPTAEVRVEALPDGDT